MARQRKITDRGLRDAMQLATDITRLTNQSEFSQFVDDVANRFGGAKGLAQKLKMIFDDEDTKTRERLDILKMIAELMRSKADMSGSTETVRIAASFLSDEQIEDAIAAELRIIAEDAPEYERKNLEPPNGAVAEARVRWEESGGLEASGDGEASAEAGSDPPVPSDHEGSEGCAGEPSGDDLDDWLEPIWEDDNSGGEHREDGDGDAPDDGASQEGR